MNKEDRFNKFCLENPNYFDRKKYKYKYIKRPYIPKPYIPKEYICIRCNTITIRKKGRAICLKCVKERKREITRAWFENHKERVKIYNKRKYEKIKNSPELSRLIRMRYKTSAHRPYENAKKDRLSITDWDELKYKFAFRCLACRRKEPEIVLTIDHVLPVTKGGRHLVDNIQPLCRSCNSKKGTKLIDYRPLAFL